MVSKRNINDRESLDGRKFLTCWICEYKVDWFDIYDARWTDGWVSLQCLHCILPDTSRNDQFFIEYALLSTRYMIGYQVNIEGWWALQNLAFWIVSLHIGCWMLEIFVSRIVVRVRGCGAGKPSSSHRNNPYANIISNWLHASQKKPTDWFILLRGVEHSESASCYSDKKHPFNLQ